jgi:hypothetical protein
MDASVIFSLLDTACYSPLPDLQQAAMKNLQDYEAIEGFVYSLTQIIESDQIPASKSNCRLLAVITLKNVVSRCWKTRGSTVLLVSSNEKYGLKEFILRRSLSTENEKGVLTQLIVLMSNIARIDWPNEWVELLPSLFKTVQLNGDNQNDAILYFEAVLEELSGKSIPNARNTFNDSAVHMFPYFASKWLEIITAVLLTVDKCLVSQSNADLNVEVLTEANALLEQLLIFTNILKIIVTRTFTSLSTNIEFTNFFQSYMTLQYKYSQIIQNLPPNMIHVVNGCSTDETVSCILIAHHSEKLIPNVMNDVLKMNSNVIPNISNVTSANVFGVIMRLTRASSTISSLPTALLKEYPLQMVPFLNAFLNLYYTSLLETSRRFIIAPFNKHSRIAALLFLSNTLYEKSYTKEVNTVAKLKEKLLRSIGTLNGGQVYVYIYINVYTYEYTYIYK